MIRFFTRMACALSLVLITVINAVGQTAVSGVVVDRATRESLPGVSVSVKGRTEGGSTNGSGQFSFTTTQAAPFTLVVSYIGYATVERQISGQATGLRIELEQQGVLGTEVVVAASRTPENILQSPVSIERVGTAAIQQQAAASFYDALANMKGVELSAQSLTFKSVNTRGFNANGNVRFNQFVDGMDNQAPGLNFAVGNIVGVSELDVDNVELLPGASSALYGAGGTNGTLLITSKSPFTYQGFSALLKTGVNHLDNFQRDASPYQDMSLRYARAFNDKLAFKVNFSYLTANDWQAQDFSNFNRVTQTTKPGDRVSDPNYDGVNIYGDEINTTFGATAGFLNGQTVSRTGYAEDVLVDYDTKSIKASGAIHYKISNTIEAIAQGNWGAGTSVYTGSDRYSLKDFTLGQYKLELRSADFFIRGYTTQERSGDAYNATALGTLINEYWKPSTTWFTQYAQTYNGARLGMIPGGVRNNEEAHLLARAAADAGRPQPGSPEFNTLKNDITNRTIGPGGGARFNDKTNLYNVEGMYNFTGMLNNVADVLVGASYRTYDLNSDGTIFDDLTRDIKINEVGAYAQVAKRLFAEKLKLTGSVRYDKNENFEGQFTPRLSGVYTVAPNNNVRVSYQTGYRNPTTQNQYIDLLVRANTRLIGGLPEVLDKYNLRTNKGYTQASIIRFQQSVAAGTPNPALLETYTFGEFKPESVQAWEIGYKGLIGNKLLIDTYYYFNSYKNFVSTLNLIQPGTPSAQDPTGLSTGRIFSTVVNNPATVEANGFAVGADYLLGKFNLNGNVSYNKLTDANNGLITEFNTPEYRYNLGLSNSNVYRGIGFNLQYRWQDEFNWQSTFAAGTIPAYGTVDAQVSYKIPSLKSIVKVGGSNVLNNYYRTSFGNPQMGGIYYVSLLFDQFLR